MASLDRLCRDTFVYFYEKVYKSPCPDLISDSKEAEAVLNEFAKYIDNKYQRSVGPNYVYSYVLFQFSRYYDQMKKNVIKNPTGKITIKLVFGERALEIYESRRTDMDFMLNHSPLILEVKVSKSELAFKKGVIFTDTKMQSKPGYRDPLKAISSSGDDPLSTCEETTDLYDHNDPSCESCSMNVQCKQLLKTKYPNIYKRKNYE